MAEWVDLLDSANQKFDGSSAGMSSANAEAGIIEAYERVVPDGGVEGQIIVKNSATEQDASWYEIPTPLSSTWGFNNNTAATDPGAGKFKLNAATQAAATALYFNDQNASGISIGQYLQQLKVGQDIICIQANQISRAARYEVAGAVVDNTGWYTVPVTFVDQGSGGEFQNGKNVVFDFSGLGGGSIVSWGEIVGTLSDQLDLQAELDAKEPWLDNPATDGFVLSSTVAGVRSWVSLGTTDLSNAVFPDSAHFANEVAAVSAVDFNAGNKQLISGSAGNITLAAPGVGSYMLYVADSGTITGIADSGAGTITWVGPVPTWAAGKLAAIACGRTGAGNWILNGSVEE